MTQIITVFNQAGGVGKSSTTMNIGHHLALMGKRVLLVDMDPQASLTTFLGLEPSELENTIYDSIIAGKPLPIYQAKEDTSPTSLHGMHLVPANIQLSGAEIELASANFREQRLKEALEGIEALGYDYVLIDCPPSLGILSFISLVACTHVLIPIETQFKALKGTELLFNTIALVKKRGNKNIQIAGVIPTKHNKTTNQAQRALETISALSENGIRVFPAIPSITAFSDASEQGIPLCQITPKRSTNKEAIEALKAIAQKIVDEVK